MQIRSKKKDILRFEDALRYCTKSVDESEKKSPRAAVYATKVGRNSKKVIQMQDRCSNSKTISSNFSDVGNNSNKVLNVINKFFSKCVLIKVAMLALISVILLCVFCYQPAKVYYTQVRQTQKAEAELALVQARNDILTFNVNSLKTSEGIEDKAKKDYGYVSKGEGVARVSGLETQKSSVLPTYVDSNKVVAPSTPVTNVLDVLFSYDNSPK